MKEASPFYKLGFLCKCAAKKDLVAMPTREIMRILSSTGNSTPDTIFNLMHRIVRAPSAAGQKARRMLGSLPEKGNGEFIDKLNRAFNGTERTTPGIGYTFFRTIGDEINHWRKTPFKIPREAILESLREGYLRSLGAIP